MQNVSDISLAVGVVIAASVALQASLGPTLTAIVDALKATNRIPKGWSGVMALAVGCLLGMATGLIAVGYTNDTSWLLVGGFAGLLLGAGGIQSHEANIGSALLKKRLDGTTDTTAPLAASRDRQGGEAAFTPWPPRSDSICGQAAPSREARG